MACSRLLRSLFAVLAFLALAAPCRAGLDPASDILILHSYHAGFPWTDEIQAAILTEFRRHNPHFEPYVEYLDWKRFPNRDNLEAVAQIMASKYAGKRFSLVLVSDNAALDFALKRRETLFPGAPIVFCGINGFSETMIAGHEGVTGVVEDLDVAGTMAAALALLPKTNKFLTVLENTETGQVQRADILKAARRFQGRVETVVLDNPSLEDVMRACGREAGKDTVMLLGSFGRDRTGRIFPDFGVDLFSAGCDTPIFVMWEFLVGKGAVGGSVLSGKLQGREAAALGLRVLSGERQAPVIRTAPTQLLFDNQQMRRFGIDASLLPKDSLIINEPVTLFNQYRNLIPGILTTMMFMALAIALLSANILARRRAERELDKAKALLTAAIECSPQGIMVAEAPAVAISLANPAAKAILGLNADAVGLSYLREEDVSWRCFSPAGERYAVRELALPRAVLDGAVSDNVEMRVMRADGQERWILLSGSPIRDGSGGIVAGIIVFADITARKRMEDMVVQSEKMVSLGGLAAGMAHEINNPLGIIVQSAQNALRRISPELPANERIAQECGATLQAVRAYLEARHITTYLQDVLDAGHRAARIVRGMLGFSRPAQTERKLLKASELLDKAVELAQSDFDLKKNYDIRKVSFQRSYHPSGPSGFFVETEILQVFLNIIKNAAQAMASKTWADGGEPVIDLGTGLEGDMIVARIADNGPGMEEKVCKRIMEPFFTTKGVGEGTGLGLSVSYYIVTNSYGGSLEVCSAPGQGSTFTVRLPRGRPAHG